MVSQLTDEGLEPEDRVIFYGSTWDRFVGLHNLWIAIALTAAYMVAHFELCEFEEHGTINEPCTVLMRPRRFRYYID